MKNLFFTSVVVTVALSFFAISSANAATGIFGGYLTIDSVKYKTSGIYAGPEPVFDGADLGTFDVSTDTLVLSQGETFTFQNSGHSTFEFAIAYRVRLATDPKSTNPADYNFILMGDGATYTGASSGDEKAEFTGGTHDLFAGIVASATFTDYAVDVVHKVGAWEGGSNFERLANRNNADPGDTLWGSVDAFSAEFTVVPEPSSFAMIGGMLALAATMLRRQSHN
jgi:PEP-CTERM putative exosortase interaction domain